jgi:tryptophan-rich sensory protein
MLIRTIIFLIINFLALGIGGLFTNKGVSSAWYSNLNKAPWTPPGWVFGAAWTVIMVCFAFYMAYLWQEKENKKMLIALFAVQLILNIAWNPAFFFYQNVQIGLIVISCLTLLVGYFLINYWPELKFKSLFILPYFVWLLIATSLNVYILLKN